MSSGFDAMLQADAAALLSADGEFAEQITVTPKGKAPRTVYANVNRHPRAQVGADGSLYAPHATFDLRNHATLGITMAETATGLTVTYNVRYGDATSAKTMPAHLSPTEGAADAGMIRIEV